MTTLFVAPADCKPGPIFMPELPEVATVVKGLADRLLGRRLNSVSVLDARMLRAAAGPFERALTGRRLAAIHRHGKGVFIEFSGSATPSILKVHLGMTGQLVFEPAATPTGPHTHIVFRFEGLSDELRYRDMRRFGRVGVLASLPRFTAPDAWDAPVEVVRAALARRRGMLKALLLNQSVIAGVGNIYADEALFRAKLHPGRRMETLKAGDIDRLVAAVRFVLGESIKLGGTSFRNYVDTAGGRGGFKGRLSVYGKTGAPCPACRTPIRKFTAAGRGTHICPACQPAPRRKRRA